MDEHQPRIGCPAPNGSRFVVAVFDHGELITEIFLDGPTPKDFEDDALLLKAAADQHVHAKIYGLEEA